MQNPPSQAYHSHFHFPTSEEAHGRGGGGHGSGMTSEGYPRFPTDVNTFMNPHTGDAKLQGAASSGGLKEEPLTTISRFSKSLADDAWLYDDDLYFA